ncbi:hypothetical protein ANN_07633 [Periplaneta americana]|uniref:Uncharacterized protein n=1 Tax=Periplaneta americana TaxID=6978 RepID=A0ABQ8SZ54_PERAM|nr:hypothetical protein ANN_07633 [Periplaneta americana]
MAGGNEPRVVVITEDVQNVHLLLEYRPHIDVSLTCEHDPKLQEYWDRVTAEQPPSLADILRQYGLEVHEEVHCTSEDDSTRQGDIVVIDRKKNTEAILDPTIRFERDPQQLKLTDDGKRIIYEPCIPYFSKQYNIMANRWTSFWKA